MIEQDNTLSPFEVSFSERLARIVLSPRDLDAVTGHPKDSFISLREGETGISFLRFDWMGETAFLNSGHLRADLYNKGTRRQRYSFVGWMQGLVQDIIALSPETISVVVDEARPEHVNVCFLKDGDLIKGKVTDAYILDLMDELYHCLEYIEY